MRWQLTIQAAVGLGALFAFGHFAVDRFVRPVGEEQAKRIAMSDARVAGSEVAMYWERLRTLQRTSVTTAVTTDAISSMGSVFQRGDPNRGLTGALESVAAQAGSDTIVALLDGKGEVVSVTNREAAAGLGVLPAAKSALAGATSVRFAVVERKFYVTAAAPVSSGDRIKGALIVASPMNEKRLTNWAGLLPGGASVALSYNDMIIANTLPPTLKNDLAPMGVRNEVSLAGRNYAVSTRELIDDAGEALLALGLAPISPKIGAESSDRSVVDGLVEGVQTFMVLVGALAFALVALVILLSPGGRPGEVATRAVSEPAFTRADFADSAPSMPPPPPPPDVEPDVSQTRPLPAVPAATLEPAHQPSMPPAPPPPVAEPAFAAAFAETFPSSPSSSPSQPPPPAEEQLFAASEPPPVVPAAPDFAAADPFEAIAAAAAAARPPAPAQAPGPIHGETDLPIPKGGLPAGVPPLDASSGNIPKGAHATPADLPVPVDGFPSNLPVPKSDPFGMPSAPPQPSFAPASSAPTQASHTPAPASMSQAPSYGSAVPLPGSAPSNPPQPAGAGAIPLPGAAAWQSQPPPSDGPSAYDESHYRVVFKEFVASKARLGEAVDNITFEGFSAKLRTSEQALIDRHGCRAVRFQVLVKDKTVSLRPQLVR